MPDYQVVEGPIFRRSLAEKCGGLVRLEEHISRLKWNLERSPHLGRKLHPENPRFWIDIESGTLDWKCTVDYRLEGNLVILQDIWPALSKP